MNAALAARLKAKTESNDQGCWIWQGKIDRYGYPLVKIAGAWVLAHRVSHREFVGPIPEGYEVDHLCFVTACICPAHLEAVTPAENIDRARRAGRLSLPPTVHANAAKTHCKRGHPLSGDNLAVRDNNGKPQRQCRACQRLTMRALRVVGLSEARIGHPPA